MSLEVPRLNPKLIEPDEMRVIDFFKRADATLKPFLIENGMRNPEDEDGLKDTDFYPQLGRQDAYDGGLEEVVYSGGQLAADLSSSTIMNRDLTVDRINATVAVVNEYKGERLPYDEFAVVTQGVPAEKAPSELITHKIIYMDDLMHAGGYVHGYSTQSRAAYLAGSIKGSKIIDAYRREEEVGARLIGDSLGISLVKPDLKPENSDKPWAAAFTTDESGKLIVKINNNEMFRHTRFRLAELSAEEGPHATMYVLWQRAVAARVINAAFSTTLSVTPEITQFEAVPPITRRMALTPSRSLRHHMEEVHKEIKNMVYNNALVDVNNGIPEDEVISEALRLMPLVKPAQVEALVGAVHHDPIYRAMFSAYWPAQKMANIIMSIQNPDIRQLAIRGLVSRPERPAYLAARLEELRLHGQINP